MDEPLVAKSLHEIKENYGERITYAEQMLKAYDEMIYKERLYLNNLKYEKEKNQRKFKIYLFVFVLVTMVIAGGMILGNIGYLKNGGEAAAYSDFNASQNFFVSQMRTIVTMISMIVLAFAVPGDIFILYKLIHYGRRFGKEIDNRDFTWKTYEDMISISVEKQQECVLKRSELTAGLEFDRARLSESIEKAREDYELHGTEPEAISMSELFYVKETRREELPETKNPLLERLR